MTERRASWLLGVTVTAAYCLGWLTVSPASAQGAVVKGTEVELLNADEMELALSADVARTSLLLRNKGKTAVADPVFTVLLADGKTRIDLKPASGTPLTLRPETVTVAQLEGNYPKHGGLRDGLLSVESEGSVVAAAPITPRLDARLRNVVLPMVGGALLAALAVFLGGRNHLSRLRESIAHDASWEFGKSWAATFTAVGALLATVLGASEVVEDALPGVPLAQFVGLNLLFGGLAVLAPVVFLALQLRRDIGSIGGFLLATFFTLLGVCGQLLTILGLFTVAGRGAIGGGTIALAAGIVLALFVVVSYGRRSILWRLPEGALPLDTARSESVSLI